MTTMPTSPPPSKWADGAHDYAEALHFNRITRVARDFGAGFQPNRHPHVADAKLVRDHVAYPAVLSFEPRSALVRLSVTVAHLVEPAPGFANPFSKLQARTSLTRVDCDDERGGTVRLQATVCCPPQSAMVEGIIEQVFSDLGGILWDPCLPAALEIIGARTCARHLEAW